MKLPQFLSRLRRPPAPDSPAPVPTPEPVQAAPVRSRTERLNQWLALGANIGVLLGLIILIVEVRQNAALSRAAMEQQKNDVLAEIERYIAKPEIRTLDGILVALMLQWDHRFRMESAGLVDRKEARQHVLNSAPYYFGSRFAKHWWSLQASGWEGTPMMEVAGPIVEATDENFLADYLDKLKLAPSEPQVEAAPSVPEGNS